MKLTQTTGRMNQEHRGKLFANKNKLQEKVVMVKSLEEEKALRMEREKEQAEERLRRSESRTQSENLGSTFQGQKEQGMSKGIVLDQVDKVEVEDGDEDSRSGSDTQDVILLELKKKE
ncbi:uncharacterized protein MELLADRAFT_59414 [Melampsora larici-populina 98AG31]|uniref:Uncharacterized protein n=1 Tax=Melampsora larici-populina (strain 98AG31 / pathotype 3-4-7) TaxID=747676 RepID=F4R7E3_MELLP|nr:uncharacterized protein MELLADRAFT_59414 [Melampsora larici-populina 98AG31]EGG11802.1 hypothetical protein MELLADRAFT_59414 [Melampsora larici-populina 98AG31]